MKLIRNKSSQSEYHLNTMCNRSGSLNNLRSINNNQLNDVRYSVCECNSKKTSFILNKQRKSTKFSYSQPKMKHTRRHNSEKYLFNPTKYSLSSNASAISSYNHQHPLHYITCKRDSNHSKLSAQLSSTTITSNLTRSTMNTSSENSFLIDQTKSIRQS